MNKIRVLSLLSLIVCISAFSLGFDNFSTESTETITATWTWGLLALFGIYGIISAISIALLSFFALQTDSDNSYIVDKKSLYGRLFLCFVDLKYKNDFSICYAFWKTNLILFIGSILVGLVITAGIFIYTMGIKDMAIIVAFILCIVFVLVIFAILCELGENAYDQLRVNKPKVANAIEFVKYKSLIGLMIILLICLVGLIGFLGFILYSIGMATIWSCLVTWIPYLAMWTIMICACIAGIYGIYKMAKRLFGEEFSSFYHQNLCPKIKIR